MAGVLLIIIIIFWIHVLTLVVRPLCGVGPCLHWTVSIHQNSLKRELQEKGFVEWNVLLQHRNPPPPFSLKFRFHKTLTTHHLELQSYRAIKWKYISWTLSQHELVFIVFCIAGVCSKHEGSGFIILCLCSCPLNTQKNTWPWLCGLSCSSD